MEELSAARISKELDGAGYITSQAALMRLRFLLDQLTAKEDELQRVRRETVEECCARIYKERVKNRIVGRDASVYDECIALLEHFKAELEE